MDEEEHSEYDQKTPKPRRVKEQYLILIVIVLIAILLYILIAPLFNDLVGEKALDFKLKDIDGTEFRLSDNFGKVIILDIMTTTCPACIEEMKHLKALSGRYSSEDVMIITISVDSGDSNSDLSAFKTTHKANWTFARDTDSVADKYNVRYTPTVVIIDKEGIIRYYHEGESSGQKLSREIDKLI